MRHILKPLAQQIDDPLAAAKAGEGEKQERYKDICRRNQVEFLPAAFQSSGAMGSAMRDHLKTTAHEYGRARGIGDADSSALRREFLERWSVWFSATLAKGYADRIRNICYRNLVPLKLT